MYEKDTNTVNAKTNFYLLKKSSCIWILLTIATATTTHPDLTELHLDLFGDYIGPIFLSQEVPEYPSEKCIYPGLRLRSLL